MIMIMEIATVTGENAGGGGGVDTARDFLTVCRAIESTAVTAGFL